MYEELEEALAGYDFIANRDYTAPEAPGYSRNRVPIVHIVGKFSVLRPFATIPIYSD